MINVEQLIEMLSQVEDKSLPVFIWWDGDISPVNMIDELDDRVDINVEV